MKMGRKKIEIKLLKERSIRQVTFSKRRAGLFKKANELATLCGAQVALVAFSPGDTPFSFGFPSVQTVVQRYLKPEKSSESAETEESKTLEQLSKELNEVNEQNEMEAERREMLAKGLEEMNIKPVNEMNLEEIREMKAALLDLKERVNRCVVEIEASSSLLLLSKEETEGNK